MTKDFRAIGLMSGTSADGISAAIVEVEYRTGKPQLRLAAYRTYKYSRNLQNDILEMRRCGADELCKANFRLGTIFADAVKKITDSAGLKPSDIDVVGSHGQTVCHLPKSATPSTLQIGEPSIIAEKTGITTVADFRCRDISAGGEGAPLIPYLDYVLFGGGEPVALQNIGGIANVTVVSRLKENTLAFDTGPGNMLIDDAVRRLTKGKLHYDKDGRLAKKGNIYSRVLDAMRSHPYFYRKPPKSCGREEFGAGFFDKYCASLLKSRPYDLIATLTYFTAESIVLAYNKFISGRFPMKKVIVSGGGVFNPVLLQHLKRLFYFVEVENIAEYGIHPLAKEPMAFALLALETIRGVPTNIKSATGAENDTLLGKIIPGRNSQRLIRKIYG